jgi:hypothetical protein
MFRRKRKLTCTTNDEIVSFNVKLPNSSPQGSPIINNSSVSPNSQKKSFNLPNSPLNSPIIGSRVSRLSHASQLSQFSQLSPNGARSQRSGSFEKLSGLLGPEAIEEIKKLSKEFPNEYPEIN